MFKKKEVKPIDGFEDKIKRIRDVLKETKNPLTYNEIAIQADMPVDETTKVIGRYFSNITKESTSVAIPHDDLFLFGDNVMAIKDNFWYKVMKARFNVGQKTAKYTRGHLR